MRKGKKKKKKNFPDGTTFGVLPVTLSSNLLDIDF